MITTDQKIQIPPIPADAEIRLAKPPDAPSISPPKDHLAWVDGLRAIACIMVILCHTSIMMPSQWTVFSVTPWDRTITLAFDNKNDYFGFSGVNLFLVLSGFCLYWPLTKDLTKTPTLKAFLTRRFMRLAPPYYVALVLAATFSYWKHWFPMTYTFRWLLVHMAFLQMSFPQYEGTILGQTWSLALEWQCYLLFPLFVVAFKKFGFRPVVLATIIINIAYRHWAWPETYWTRDQGDCWVTINNAAGRCSEFVIGMACASILRNFSTTGKMPIKWFDFLILIPGLFQFGKIWAQMFLDGGAIRVSSTSDVALGIFYGSIMLVSMRFNEVRRFLSFKPLVWFGTISYSIYLTHGHVLLFFHDYLHMARWPCLFLAQLFVLVPACAGVGYVFFIAFERPFLTKKKMVTSVHRIL